MRTNKELFRIRNVGDFYSRNILEIIVDILIDWNYNHGTQKISRNDILDKIKEHIKCDVNAYKMRYVNPYGVYGPTYFEKAVDLFLSSLRIAGCIKNDRYYVGEYIVTDDMYRYMSSNRQTVTNKIMSNFRKDEFDREDLVTTFAKETPRPKAILIKKNKTAEGVHTERKVVIA